MNDRVDNQVVKMTFDNAKFSENVEDTIAALRKLERSLEFKDADKGLERIEGAAGNTASAMDDLSDSVDETRVKFSALQVIGVTVLSSLTIAAMRAGTRMARGLWEPIISGGARRSQNIANARFQIEGLLKDEQNAWQKIKEDIDYGVKDTAYGFDAAAKIASQLLASGTQIGDDMKVALRSISGVAAMTNSAYEDIGYIYATIKANGKLMTEQLRQFSARGLNVAAVLAETMGKTEQEINDMVSKGKISFEEFANAMDNAFGEHAKEANKTFNGALSNMRAALARTGAMFADPIFENLKNIFNDVRNIVNDVNKTLGPIVEYFTAIVELQSSWFHKFAETGDVARTIAATLITIFTWIRPIIGALAKVGVLNGQFAATGQTLSDFILNLQLYGDRAKKVEAIFVNLFESIKTGFTIIKGIGIILKPLLVFALRILGNIFHVSGDISESVIGMHRPIQDMIISLSKLVALGLEGFLNTVYKILVSIPWKFIINSIKLILFAVVALTAAVINFTNVTINAIRSILSAAPDIHTVVNGIASRILSIGNGIRDTFNTITRGATGQVTIVEDYQTDDDRNQSVLGSTQRAGGYATGGGSGIINTSSINAAAVAMDVLKANSDSAANSVSSVAKSISDVNKESSSGKSGVIESFAPRIPDIKESMLAIDSKMSAIKKTISEKLEDFKDSIYGIVSNLNPIKIALIALAAAATFIVVEIIKIIKSVVTTITVIPKMLMSMFSIVDSVNNYSKAAKYSAFSGVVLSLTAMMVSLLLMSKVLDISKVESLLEVLKNFAISIGKILLWIIVIVNAIDILDSVATIMSKFLGAKVKVNPIESIGKIILRLAIGVALLTASMYFLVNNFDESAFVTGIRRIGIMIGLLTAYIYIVSALINKFDMFDSTITKFNLSKRSRDSGAPTFESTMKNKSGALLIITLSLVGYLAAMTYFVDKLGSYDTNSLIKSGVFIAANIGVLAGAMSLIFASISKFTDLLEADAQLKGNDLKAIKITSSLNKTLAAMTTMIREITVYLSLLSISLLLMSKIDPDDLWTGFWILNLSIGAMSFGLAILAAIGSRHYNSANAAIYIESIAKTVTAMVPMFAIISGSIIILSIIANKFDSLSSVWVSGIAFIATVASTIAIVGKFMKGFGNMSDISGNLKELVNVIRELSIAMIAIGSIVAVLSIIPAFDSADGSGLISSIIGLYAVMAFISNFLQYIVGMTNQMTGIEDNVKKGLDILTDTISRIVPQIMLMALTLSVLSTIPFFSASDGSGLMTGITALYLVMLSIGLLIKSIESIANSMNVTSFAIFNDILNNIIVVVLAISVLSAVIGVIAKNVPSDQINIILGVLFGITALMIVLGVIASVMKDPSGIKTLSESIFIMASSLIPMAAAFAMLSSIEALDANVIDSLKSSFLAIASTFAIITTVGAIIGPEKAKSVQTIAKAYVMMAASMAIALGAIFLVLENLDYDTMKDIANNIGTVTGVLVGFTLAVAGIIALTALFGKKAETAVKGINSLSRLLLSFGVACVLIGQALLILGDVDFHVFARFAKGMADAGEIITKNIGNFLIGLGLLAVMSIVIYNVCKTFKGIATVVLIVVAAGVVAIAALSFAIDSVQEVITRVMEVAGFITSSGGVLDSITLLTNAFMGLSVMGIFMALAGVTMLVGAIGMLGALSILAVVFGQLNGLIPDDYVAQMDNLTAYMRELSLLGGFMLLAGASLILGGALLIAGGLLFTGGAALLLAGAVVMQKAENSFYNIDPFGFIEDMRAFSGGIAILGIDLVLGGGLLTLGAAAGLIAAGVLWLAMKLFEQCSKLFVNITKNMRTGVASLVGIVTDIIESISDLAETLTGSSISEWFEVGRNIVQGLIEGIQDLAAEPLNVLEDIGNNIVDGFCSFFGIHSPSTVMWELAQFLMQGLSNGINDGSVDVDNGVSGFCSSIWNKVQNLGQNLPDLFSGEFNWQNMGGNFLTTLKNIVNFLSGNVTPAFEAAGLNAGAAFGNSASAGIYDALGKASVVMGEAMRAYEIQKEGIIRLRSQYESAYTRRNMVGNDGVFTINIGGTEYRFNQRTWEEKMASFGTEIDRLDDQIKKTNQLIRDAQNVNTLTNYDFIDLDKFLGGTSGAVGGITGSSGIASSISGASGAGSGINDTSRIGSGNNINSNNTYNFIQNNYSPEPLERTELYRQTRSQLNDFYGAMGY